MVVRAWIRFSVIMTFCLLIVIKDVRAARNRREKASSIESLESIFLRADGNQVVSPLSIHEALIPLQLGADGLTKAELDSTLKGFRLERNTSQDFINSQEISSTTVVFSDASLQLLPEFKRDLSNAAVQSVENFDFKNYEKINEFIKNATDGLIQNLVGPGTLPIDTVLAVINGVHFDALWKHPFEKTFKNIPFTLTDGTVEDIPMMRQTSSSYFAKVPSLDAQVIEIPYKSLTKVLRIYLPSKHDGLETMLKTLKTFNTSEIPLRLREIEVTLPKFKIETQIRVTDGLERLGLKSLATSDANLTRMAVQPVQVDNIISKSVIEVSESGTKAGSASGIFVVPLSGFIGDVLVVNRPFYFEIRDTGSAGVYFSGVFTTPDPPPTETGERADIQSRVNQTAELQKLTTEPESEESINSEVDTWWLHSKRPEYLATTLQQSTNFTPRFQQPEPNYPSGIRFPYPLNDSNTKHILDTYLRNVSRINTVI